MCIWPIIAEPFPRLTLCSQKQKSVTHHANLMSRSSTTKTVKGNFFFPCTVTSVELDSEMIALYLKYACTLVMQLYSIGKILSSFCLSSCDWKLFVCDCKWMKLEKLLRGWTPLYCNWFIYMSFSGMAALDGRASGRMGLRAVIYYTTTTVIAVFIGIVLVLIIHPGKGSKDEFSKPVQIQEINPSDAFLDLIRYWDKHVCTCLICQ